MQPLSIALISGTVGGLAGAFAGKMWDAGEKWLRSFFRDHNPRAQEKAMQNALFFISDLAHRVQQIEKKTEDDQELREKMNHALEDPDFSALLKDAIIASSRTSSEDKRKVLARIVSERLRCPPEGLVALTSILACDAVKYLTPDQMMFLGLAALVYYIRPIPLPSEEIGKYYVDWLSKSISPFLPLKSPSFLDLLHLESVSCIKPGSVPVYLLRAVLRPSTEGDYGWPYDDFVKDNAGRQLSELWDNVIQKYTLTTPGQLLGVYVYDELNKTKTGIDWEFPLLR